MEAVEADRNEKKMDGKSWKGVKNKAAQLVQVFASYCIVDRKVQVRYVPYLLYLLIIVGVVIASGCREL